MQQFLLKCDRGQGHKGSSLLWTPLLKGGGQPLNRPLGQVSENVKTVFAILYCLELCTRHKSVLRGLSVHLCVTLVLSPPPIFKRDAIDTIVHYK